MRRGNSLRKVQKICRFSEGILLEDKLVLCVGHKDLNMTEMNNKIRINNAYYEFMITRAHLKSERFTIRCFC